jgi:hypothetical protein
MVTLVEFLRARLDEDARLASAATTGPWRWVDPGRRKVRLALVGQDETVVLLIAQSDAHPSVHDAEHITRHDPARVLADVAAKRAILEWHAEGHYCTDLGNLESWYLPESPCPTLRALVTADADHPDYDPAWQLAEVTT